MDSFATTFEKVIASTTNLSVDEINDTREIYEILSMPQGGLSHKQARHMMALLGYRDCEFPPGEKFLDFEHILEMTAKKKEAISSREAEYQQVFRLMDVHNQGFVTNADLKKFLQEVEVRMEDGDGDHLTEMISNAYPDKFSESDFVAWMVEYAAQQQERELKEAQMKQQQEQLNQAQKKRK